MLACLLSLLLGFPPLEFIDELEVLSKALPDSNSHQLVYDQLLREAETALAARTTALAAIKDKEAAQQYQIRMCTKFLASIGGLQDRTPLNPRITGTLRRDGYSIEKVIFESRPGFHVTANLYLPDTEPPFPGVIVPCGHSDDGKAADTYQAASVLLARNGIAALCYDPVGQGERKQLLDRSSRGRFGPTTEHMILAPSLVLLGRSLAGVMLWDGMRALDYLSGRAEIDPDRLGCSGNSGGGTQTSHLMALDPRVRCAAPSCYVTSFDRLLHTIGPQDAEQNIFGQLAWGMEHADYLNLRAPRPTLICAASGDFFDIGGTWDSFREAKRFYSRFGLQERVDLVEADARHGFSPTLRVGMVRWMRRWLLGLDDPIEELPFTAESVETLRGTPDGQVVLLEGARRLHDLKVEEDRRLAVLRKQIRETDSQADLRRRVRAVTGIRTMESLPECKVNRLPGIDRDDYSIERWVIHGPTGIPLPALAFVPAQPATAPPILFLHPGGKHVEAVAGGRLERWANQGREVLAVDLSGIGELTHQGSTAFAEHAGPNWQPVMLAYLLGKSFLALRTEEILGIARLLSQADSLTTLDLAYSSKLASPRPVEIIATGELTPPALHASALEPELISATTLEQALMSWHTELVLNDEPKNLWVNAVHGALQHYDLADLARLVRENSLTPKPATPAGGNDKGGR